MADYKKMYSTLFNAITDVISILQKAQKETEELYISAAAPNITLLEKPVRESNDENKT